MKKTVKCRLVKIKDEQGKIQVLCTSLLDLVKYKLAELGELYRIRWGIEEGYKMYNARVQVKAFSGRTTIAVKQDIFSKAMMMTIYAALAFPIEEHVVKEYKADQKKGLVKHPRKINRTFAYWSIKGILVGKSLKGLSDQRWPPLIDRSKPIQRSSGLENVIKDPRNHPGILT